MSKSQVDRYSSALFLFQAVGIDASQCLDQRGLAVIDVAGGADDDGFHWNVQYMRQTMIEEPQLLLSARNKCVNF